LWSLCREQVGQGGGGVLKTLSEATGGACLTVADLPQLLQVRYQLKLFAPLCNKGHGRKADVWVLRVCFS
jgi:hypothetical protein